METIFQTIVGSKLYGIDNEESDLDLKGYCFPNISAIIGLDKFEQIEQNNGLTGKKKIECVIYGIEKFFRLCLKGNPTVLELAFAERVPGMVQISSHYSESLNRFIRENLIVKSIFRAYFGYFRAQVQKLKTKKYDDISRRRELFVKYGYDVKFAAHAYRLGRQCVELLNDSANFSPTLSDYNKDMILSILNGKLSHDSCLMHLRFLEQSMRQAESLSILPRTYDYAKAKNFYFNLVYDYLEEHYFY